jgi:hypothetical protein
MKKLKSKKYACSFCLDLGCILCEDEDDDDD